MKRQPTRGHVQAAIRAFATACQPTARERAEIRLQAAKQRMSEAAQAVLDNHPDAARMGDAALEMLTAAKAALALLDQAEEPTA